MESRRSKNRIHGSENGLLFVSRFSTTSKRGKGWKSSVKPSGWSKFLRETSFRSIALRVSMIATF